MNLPEPAATIHRLTEKLREDLAFAAPELWPLHIEKRLAQAFEAGESASPRQGEPVEGHDPEAKCRTCGHREHDHHHSADPRWCGADFAMLGFTACPCPGYAALSEPAEAEQKEETP